MALRYRNVDRCTSTYIRINFLENVLESSSQKNIVHRGASCCFIDLFTERIAQSAGVSPCLPCQVVPSPTAPRTGRS